MSPSPASSGGSRSVTKVAAYVCSCLRADRAASAQRRLRRTKLPASSSSGSNRRRRRPQPSRRRLVASPTVSEVTVPCCCGGWAERAVMEAGSVGQEGGSGLGAGERRANANSWIQNSPPAEFDRRPPAAVLKVILRPRCLLPVWLSAFGAVYAIPCYPVRTLPPALGFAWTLSPLDIRSRSTLSAPARASLESIS